MFPLKVFHSISYDTWLLCQQVLLGPELDFSKLVRLLEDNHDLIDELTSQGEMDRLAAVLLEVAAKADGLEEVSLQQIYSMALGCVFLPWLHSTWEGVDAQAELTEV